MKNYSSSVDSVSLCLLLCLLLCLPPFLFSDVTVKPGEDATLHVQGPRDADITVLKWKKLESKLYTFFYRENRLYENYQHPSYRGRVKLKDPEMNRTVSVILKNVTFKDTGRYECHIKKTGSELQFIRAINLRVQDDIITAEPGQSVSLPCRALSNTDIVAAEWTRPELEPDYVMLYRNNEPVPDDQLPSYQNRVELKDGEMKDGDVTMILKNVNSNDTGTYLCRVILGETNRRKRSADPEPISIVHLEVQSGDTEERGDKEGGDERLHVGLGVGLTALVVVVAVVVGFIVQTPK